MLVIPWPSLAVLPFAYMLGLLLYGCGGGVVAKCTLLFVSFGMSVKLGHKLLNMEHVSMVHGYVAPKQCFDLQGLTCLYDVHFKSRNMSMLVIVNSLLI